MGHLTNDAKKLREYDINTHKKGFTAESIVDGNTISEYFQFKEIHKIIYHPTAIEIISYNGSVRVFYNDKLLETIDIYEAITNRMLVWMNSNRN